MDCDGSMELGDEDMPENDWDLVLEYPRGRAKLADAFAMAICRLVIRDEFAGCDGLAVRLRPK